MNLENFIAISGLPGLYTMVASKPNGLVVKDLVGGKTRFCSLRKYDFTPLETVGIYTMTDTEDLKTIFTAMKAAQSIPAPKSSKDELLSFFSKVLPTYDREKVFPNHISKIIKWYNQLEEQGLLTVEKPKKESKAKSEKKAKKEVKTTDDKDKKVAKKVAKKKPVKKTAKKTEKKPSTKVKKK